MRFKDFLTQEAIKGRGEFKVTTPGWYVVDHMDKAVDGPMQERGAKERADEMNEGKSGGDIRGFEAEYFSDYDIRRSLEEASLGSKIEFVGKKNWEDALPKSTFHTDEHLIRAQSLSKDFEGVAGTFDTKTGKGWIYSHYLKNVSEAGKVYTMPNKSFAPRGAPEQKARAFDKPGTDRSEFAKLDKTQFTVMEGELEFYDWSDPKNDELMKMPNTVQVLVKSGNDSPNGYYGINVVFDLEDTKLVFKNSEPELITSDRRATFEAKKFKDKIVALAKTALIAGEVPAIYSTVDRKNVLPKIKASQK